MCPTVGPDIFRQARTAWTVVLLLRGQLLEANLSCAALDTFWFSVSLPAHSSDAIKCESWVTFYLSPRANVNSRSVPTSSLPDSSQMIKICQPIKPLTLLIFHLQTYLTRPVSHLFTRFYFHKKCHKMNRMTTTTHTLPNRHNTYTTSKAQPGKSQGPHQAGQPCTP